MKRTPWMREAVAAGKDFSVTSQNRRAHNARNIGYTAAVLVGIAAVVAGAAAVPTVPYLLVAPWLLGSLYFSLFILVIHECSHDMFFLTRDRSRIRAWNRRIGQVFSAPFFTDYIQHWEEGHLEHHLRPCGDHDPQDRHPVTGWPLAARLAALLFVPGSVLVFNPSNQYGFSAKRLGLGLVGLVVPAVLASLLIAWPAGAAILLGMHTLQIFNMLKKAQEHGGGLADASDPLLRSRTYFYPLQRFASPFHIHYHFEHHANLRVPWYNLPAYHARMRTIVPEALQPSFFHHRYIAQAAGRFPPVDERRIFRDASPLVPPSEACQPAAR
jgi:fatty acid desaturase